MTFPLANASVDMDFTAGMYYSSGAGEVITDLLSISRASVGYAKTLSGTLMLFDSGEFRITDLGLLVEDARTNSILDSSAFDSANWGTSGGTLTITPNAAAAPDGTTTADLIAQVGTTQAFRRIASTISVSSAVTWTWSLYVKPGNGAPLRLGVSDFGGNGMFATFNTANGAASNLFNNGTATLDGTFSEVLSNGWIRVGISGHFSSSIDAIPSLFSATSADGDAFYVWGGQFEQGAFPSSLIPTTATSATRAADAISIIGNASTAFTGASGSIIVGTMPLSGSGGSLAVRNSSAASYMNIFPATTASLWNNAVSLNASLGNSKSYLTDNVRSGWSFSGSGRSVVGAGGTVATDANLDSASSPLLGNYAGTGGTLFAYLTRAAFWNSRLPDATLQALTLPGNDFYDLLNDTLGAVGRGTVGSSPTASSITTSAFALNGTAASGVVSNQFVGLSILFDGNTTTAGLQGAAALITASTASNTPTFTLITSLPATPVAGDTFSVN